MTRNRPHSYRRRGSMYVAVLGTSMMITVIGYSALTLARVERSSAEGSSDFTAARFYAQSAIEMGQHYIRENPNWRSNYSDEPPRFPKPIGTGEYSFEVTDGTGDGDGDLKDNTSESIILRGTGWEGQSRYKLQVTMVNKIEPLTCLEVAMHAGTSIAFDNAQVQSNQATISANSTVAASSSSIYPAVEAVSGLSGGTYHSATNTGIAARTMPGLSAFDHYVLNGTPILYSTLVLLHGGEIRETVLSPNSNPYGLTNPNGVYVINCSGGDLRIRNARIVGTLVVLNARRVRVEDSISWEPAVSNYPSLLVSGDAELRYTNETLKKSSTNVNFNPAGTPYGASVTTDTDKSDSYPSKIIGLVYVSSNIQTENHVTIDGVLVAGAKIDATGNLDLTYRSTFYDNPPPGFGEAPKMVISPGTWKQLVD